MENVAQVMTAINDPRQSFANELEATASAMQDLSPDMLRMALRCILFVGAHIVIDNQVAVSQTTEKMAEVFSMNKEARDIEIRGLADAIFSIGAKA